MAGVLRTADECFEAGWSDGADDTPLTQAEIEHLVALHGPYLRSRTEAS